MATPSMATIELDGGAERRFWLKTSVGDGCFEWNGLRDPKGYGRFTIKRRHLAAHRVAWTIHNGPIPSGLEIDHLCRNRACVRVDHLEPVTRQENMARSQGLSAINAAKTHCPEGHPYDEVNTFTTVRGGRGCKSCRSIRNHNAHLRRKQAKGTL